MPGVIPLVLLSVGVISLQQAGAPHPTRPPRLSQGKLGSSPRVLEDDEVWGLFHCFPGLAVRMAAAIAPLNASATLLCCS